MFHSDLRIGDQVIRFDRDATAAAYRTVARGGADECGCAVCESFAIQRDTVYPPSFRELLQQSGIDPEKEAGVFECGPASDGWQSYGGWFYLVGEMITAGERNTGDPSYEFEFFFTELHPRSAYSGDRPLLAVEFTARLRAR